MPEDNKQSFSPDPGNNSGNPQGTSFTKEGGDQPKTLEELGLSIEDVVALAKRDENAQSFIEVLKTETASLRDEVNGMKDEFAKTLQIKDALDGVDDKGDQTGTSEEELLNKVYTRVKTDLKEEGEQEVQKDNFKKVTTQLSEKYGENVDKHIQTVCAELDMTWDDAVKMAQTKPGLALKLFGGGKVKEAPQSSTTTINTMQFQNNDSDQPKPNVMNLRTDRERVANWNERLDAALRNQNG